MSRQAQQGAIADEIMDVAALILLGRGDEDVKFTILTAEGGRQV